MPELSHIDPGSAALLVMDYQVDNLTRFMTAAQSADAIACVPALIAMSVYATLTSRLDHGRKSCPRDRTPSGRLPVTARRNPCLSFRTSVRGAPRCW